MTAHGDQVRCHAVPDLSSPAAHPGPHRPCDVHSLEPSKSTYELPTGNSEEAFHPTISNPLLLKLTGAGMDPNLTLLAMKLISDHAEPGCLAEDLTDEG